MTDADIILHIAFWGSGMGALGLIVAGSFGGLALGTIGGIVAGHIVARYY